jgi:hypothetical protein
LRGKPILGYIERGGEGGVTPGDCDRRL